MGEIAEDMIDGTCCSLCGMYFMDEANQEKLGIDKQSEAVLYTHGYPVVCWDCYEEGCGYQKSDVETL
jgi:hypothetical protein